MPRSIASPRPARPIAADRSGESDRFGVARRERLIRIWLRSHAGLIALLLAVILLLQIRTWWYPTRDAVGYLSIARSAFAADGQGLRNLGSPQLFYQVGYPLLISPLFGLQQHPFVPILVIHVLLAAGGLYLVYRWAASLVGATPALALTLVVGCNTALLHYVRTTLSEIPAMFWMFAAGLALRQVLRSKSGPRTLAWAALAAGLVLIASITRYVGFCVVPGFAIAGLIAWRQKRIRLPRVLFTTAAVGLPALLAVYALVHHDHEMARTASHGATYLDYVRFEDTTLLQQAIESVRLRISEVGRLLIPGMEGAHSQQGEWLSINLALYIPVTALVIAGWWKLARRKADVIVWALPFYIAVYLAWPWDAGTRFFTPILPLLWIAIWMLIRGFPRWRYSFMVIVAGAHLLVAFGVQYGEYRKDGRQFTRYWPSCTALAQTADGSNSALAVRDLPPNVQMWMAHLLNRPVARMTGDNPPPNVNAILQPAGRTPPDGFVPRHQSGELELLTHQ